MTILVTGSAGMIGSHLVRGLLDSNYKVIGIDKNPISFDGDYEHFQIDLGNVEQLSRLFEDKHIDRIIHLAALAHASGGRKYPKSMYEYLNVECANNVFIVAAKNNVPVLFISTVDVYGFQKGTVNAETECHPVTVYGKTKYKAEQLLKDSGVEYSVFRFSPVYTKDIKRDIQKRYYLKYPKWAYQIGKDSFYEVLNIDNAVNEMVSWCKTKPNNNIRIIKDSALLETKKCIQKEKQAGRANHVIRVPRWIALCGYGLFRITGKNKYTYLLSKALFPLRSVQNGL